MFTPYDWQEMIGHRTAFVESRLAKGTAVLAVWIPEGILAFTVRRQAPKLYEIYERLLYSAIGQQSDVETLRASAIDFAHSEGFQRSVRDVTVQRVVGALSQPLKRAFADLNAAPLMVRSLFAEVANGPDEDAYYVLDFDGDFSLRRGAAYLCGDDDQARVIKEALAGLDRSSMSPAQAIEALKPIWAKATDPSGERDFDALTENLCPEAALLERNPVGERRFRRLLEPGAAV
jgi:proteasome alpha subunit